MSHSYDNLPVVVERITPGNNFYEVRYQNPGLLSHSHWYLTENDIAYYLEER